ncbi:MAG: DUF1365 domain-containing protein [Pseudomonadota bacterium]
MSRPDHIAGTTFHGRRGAVDNAFRYRVDYLALDPEAPAEGPILFSRNRRNLTALWDCDHGGAPGKGRGSVWVRDVLRAQGLAEVTAGKLVLIAQPRVLGHVFNPVSFWLAYDHDGNLRAVIAEVTNTYRDRHSYLCHHEDMQPISKTDMLKAQKVFHVSPFQPVEGDYTFRFDIRPDRIGIWIDYSTGNGGVYATLTGSRAPLSNAAILSACVRRPFGSRRVLGLIHWQALKLWWKGARFRVRPNPPAHDVSR